MGVLGARAAGTWLVLDGAEARIERATTALAERAYTHYETVLAVLTAANSDRLGRCSDDELSALRRMIFRTPVVADIGRLEHGLLACTTGVGRLPEPLDQGPPDYISPRGVRWYVDIELLISDEVRALIVEFGNANAVIDPRVLADSERPETYQAVLAIDPVDGSVVHGVGEPLPVDDATAVAAYRRPGRAGAIDGFLGAVDCHHASIICVASMEATADVLAENAAVVWSFTVMGGVTGAAGFLVGVLAFRRDRSLPSRLRRAIRRDHLHVEYQPQIDLVDRRAVGAEALVRWTDEAGVRQPPEVIVAIAERQDFISDLTDLVIRHVIRDLGALLGERPDLKVAINFAASDLADHRLIDRLDKMLTAAGVAPSQITIELTERAAGDDPGVKATLAAARAAGHKVAIDDFGVGYSSLAYLQTMPIDCLKIDKSFTDTIGTGSVRSTIVPQILDMARALDLGVVVEGVETEAQAAYFVEHGTRIGQGWAFARAMPVDAFRTWLTDWEAQAGRLDR